MDCIITLFIYSPKKVMRRPSKIFSITDRISASAIVLVLASAVVAVVELSQIESASAQLGGPLILMGIDAEDCGPGGHGPITVYRDVVNQVLAAVNNGGSGILVIDGGDINICLKPFWDEISNQTGVPVTYGVPADSFAGFAMIVIPSDESNTPGGLTDAANVALAARSSDIATFVNDGGGLLGFSQCTLSNPYQYLAGVGTFVCAPGDYSDITATPDGTNIGITDALDVSFWHDTYTTFPAFLNVLATNPNGEAAAIGGLETVIPGLVLDPRTDTNAVGTTHTVTATVSQVVGVQTQPVPGQTVDFVVSGANSISGQCVTDANGMCTFTYTGNNAGTDSIAASATVSGRPLTDTVEKIWGGPTEPTVGGELLSIDAAALLVAGTFANAYWILPVLGAIAGAAIAVKFQRTMGH